MRTLNLKALRVLVPAVLAVAAAGASAQPLEVLTLDIEAQKVGSALVGLANSWGVQIVLSEGTGEKMDVEGLRGEYRFEDALAKLLAGTGLAYEFASENLVVVREAEEPESPEEIPVEVNEGATERQIESMIVTGTRLHQGDPTVRVVTITAEDIAKRGLSSVEDVVRTIPQIFSTINNTTYMDWPHYGETVNLGEWAVGVSTANMRGFGSANTLVLLNGHRIAGVAGREEFLANLRHMPAGAVERIEVNLDGGSSVYGSDGIAGIINIITRKDVDGGKVRVRNEQSSTGADQVQLSGYFGHNWDSGSVSANLSHTESEPYSARKAGYYTNDWSFMFGGEQRYNFNVNQNNGLPYAPRSALVSASSIWGPYDMILPEGHDGTNAQPEDFQPVTAADNVEALDLDAGGATHDQSVVVNIEQSFAGRLRLWGEYFRTEAKTSARLTRHRVFAFRVPPSNAFNNFGHDVYARYNPQTETDLGLIDPPEQFSATVSDRVLAGFDFDFSEKLRLSVDWLNSASKAERRRYMMTHAVDGPLADGEHTPRVSKLLSSSHPQEAINLFGDGTGQNPTIAELYGINHSSSRSTVVTQAEAYLAGRFFDLPAGAAGFVLGAQVRNEMFADADRASDGRNINVVNFGIKKPYRKLNAYFGELSVPVFGAGNARTGFRSLVLTASARHDDYTVEGAAEQDDNRDPILRKADFAHTSMGAGFRWELTDFFLIRYALGGGFRAPTVGQLFGGQVSSWVNGVTYDPLVGDWVGADVAIGPNPDVKPERSKNLTYGFEWRPGFAQGLSIALDYSSIDFQDRISDSRELARFLPAEVYGNLPQFFVRDSTGRLLEHHYIPANIGRTKSKTWDLQISWQFDSRRFGSFTPSIYYQFVEDMFDQAAPGAEKVRSVGTSYGVNKRKINAQVEWTRGPMTVNLFYDYTPAYVNNANRLVGDHRVESRHTIDLSAAWHWDNGFFFRAGGRNILDAEFPFTLNRYGKPFDPVRVDIRGRVWFVELSYDF